MPSVETTTTPLTETSPPRPQPLAHWRFHLQWIIVVFHFLLTIVGGCYAIYVLSQIRGLVYDPDHYYLREVTFRGQIMGNATGTYWGRVREDYQSGSVALMILLMIGAFIWALFAVGEVWTMRSENRKLGETFMIKPESGRMSPIIGIVWLVGFFVGLAYFLGALGPSGYRPMVDNVASFTDPDWTLMKSYMDGPKCPSQNLRVSRVTPHQEGIRGCYQQYLPLEDQTLNTCCFQMGEFFKTWPEAKSTWVNLSIQMKIWVAAIIFSWLPGIISHYCLMNRFLTRVKESNDYLLLPFHRAEMGYASTTTTPTPTPTPIGLPPKTETTRPRNNSESST